VWWRKGGRVGGCGVPGPELTKLIMFNLAYGE
jgi:hypothetical protein